MPGQPASSEPSSGGPIGGKYRIVRAIAVGGMGCVYEAIHEGTHGRVALKILTDEAKKDPESRIRFAREAKASGRLRSRHVARVTDVDALDDGTPYIVMDYLEGRDLARELKERTRLPLSEAAAILVQVAAGVAEAHAAGIIHRDLKPGNVFLAVEGAQRVAKVLDFGISKVLPGVADVEAEVTRTTATVGTPGYMSPEQIRAPRDVDAATDVWSMGVMLYRVLVGRPPFAGNASSVAVAICHDVPVPLESLCEGLPADVVAIARETLEKDRRLRPSLVELAEVLVRHVDDSPDGAIAREAFVELARRGKPARSTAEAQVAAPSFTEPYVTPSDHGRPPFARAAHHDPLGATRIVVRAAPESAVAAEPAEPTASSPQRRRLLVGAALVVIALGAGLLAKRALDRDAPPPPAARPTDSSSPSFAPLAIQPAPTYASPPVSASPSSPAKAIAPAATSATGATGTLGATGATPTHAPKPKSAETTAPPAPPAPKDTHGPPAVPTRF